LVSLHAYIGMKGQHIIKFCIMYISAENTAANSPSVKMYEQIVTPAILHKNQTL
jgi:hypothetical protein